MTTRDRAGTNNATDHLETMTDLLNAGVLKRGDVLIMDNARIHDAEDMLPILDILLRAAGVVLYFLPRYSPEVRAGLFGTCVC